MTLYQGRDVESSLWWLLIARDSSLWCLLPKDVVKYILRWFVFPVAQCSGNCGRWMKELVSGSTYRYCSSYCASHLPDDPPKTRMVLHICVRCGILARKEGVISRHEFYCNSCWKREQKNGLFIEPIK